LEAIAMAEASKFPPINLLNNPVSHSKTPMKTLGFMWWRSFKESQFVSFLTSLVRPLLSQKQLALSDSNNINNKKSSKSKKQIQSVEEVTSTPPATSYKELDSIFHPERIEPILLPQSSSTSLPSSSSSLSSTSTTTSATKRTRFVMSDSSPDAIDAAQQNSEALLKYYLGAENPNIIIQKSLFSIIKIVHLDYLLAF